MKKVLSILFCCLTAINLFSCKEKLIDDPKVPEITEDVLKNNDILNGKMLHFVDVSSTARQEIVIPDIYKDVKLTITSTEECFSYEESTLNGLRTLKFDIKLPEGVTKKMIPVNVSMDGISKKYSRNLFILAMDREAMINVGSGEAISSVYSESMGRGTFCYGDLGNTVKPVFDYELLSVPNCDYIIADRPTHSEYMLEKSGDTYSDVMTDWSFDVGVDFKHTLGSWIKGVKGKVLEFAEDAKHKISGEFDYGMSKSMEESQSYEYYFNNYNVRCQNIKIDISSFTSTVNPNINTVDEDFLALIDTVLLNQFQDSNIDPDVFIDEWGTDIISQALYGGSYIYFYGRSENVYQNSVAYDASASLTSQTIDVPKAGNDWLKIFAAAGSDHLSLDASGDYMNESYKSASKSCEMGTSYGGNYQDDPSEWIDGFSKGDNDDASALSVIISYKPTSDTKSADKEFCLYQMDLFCGDLCNAIIMLYDGCDMTSADSALVNTITDNIELISAARQANIEANLSDEQTHKPRLIVADFMMKAADDDKHSEGTPQPFVAESPVQSGEYLIYYPFIANKYAPGKDVQGYALDTSVGEYIKTAVTEKSHIWYYALGTEGSVNPITNILFCESPSDESMVRRGDYADAGVSAGIRKNGVWVKYGKVGYDNSDAITAVCLMADEDGDIIASSGGAEINGSPSPEKMDAFTEFWGGDYTQYTGDEYKFYEKGGIVYNHHLYVGFSCDTLPIDRANDKSVYQATTW